MSLSEELRQRIDGIIASDNVVLFMKGNRHFPQCGFSATVVQILNSVVPNYTTINVLSDPEIRQGIKEYSDWPTIPQLYVRGEFIGGCDIVREMHEAGELQGLVGGGPVEPPAIHITDAAATALKEALAEAEADEHIHLSIDPSFQHALDIAPRSGPVIEVTSNGVTILVEAMSAQRAKGLTIDFVEHDGGGGFKMDNPNQPAAVVLLSPAELKAKLDAGEIKELIDVRMPAERERGTIDGSKLLDEETMKYLGQLDVSTPIAFFCHQGGRSQAAAEHFRNQGFRKLYNLAGGIVAWARDVDPGVQS